VAGRLHGTFAAYKLITQKQNNMTKNLGAFDGWFRTLLFIVAVCYAIMAGGAAWYLVIPTAILFATAVFAWCPLYEVFGIRTNKDEDIS
jgi:hypothetical protein